MATLIIFTFTALSQFNWLFHKGLIGLNLFLIVAAIFVSVMVFIVPKKSEVMSPNKAIA